MPNDNKLSFKVRNILTQNKNETRNCFLSKTYYIVCLTETWLKSVSPYFLPSLSQTLKFFCSNRKTNDFETKQGGVLESVRNQLNMIKLNLRVMKIYLFLVFFFMVNQKVKSIIVTEVNVRSPSFTYSSQNPWNFLDMEVIIIKEDDKCLSPFQLKSIRVTFLQ